MASVKPAGELRAPENPANTVPGLESKYYEGNFDGLPDFSALTPAKVGTVAFPALNVATRKMDFAIEYTGFLTVPTDGDYVFIAGSDDGSRISIGSTVVADNNGAHPFSEVEGTIGLKAGTHAFTVAYFQRDLLSGLTVSYSGPGIPRRDILPAAFSHVVARETSKAMQAATVPLPVTPPFPAGARSPSLLTH